MSNMLRYYCYPPTLGPVVEEGPSLCDVNVLPHSELHLMFSLMDKVPSGIEPMLKDLEDHIMNAGLADMVAAAETITSVCTHTQICLTILVRTFWRPTIDSHSKSLTLILILTLTHMPKMFSLF